MARILTGPVSFWFLWILFWEYLVFQLSLYLHQRSEVKSNYVSIFFALILIGVMAVSNIKIFGFHLFAYYFSFYALGYYMGQHKLLNINSRWILGILVVLWLSLAMGWSMHLLPSWMPTIPYLPTSMVQLAYRFTTAFIAIVVLLNVSPSLLSGTGKANAVMSKLGFYSLGIYATHYLIIWWVADLVCKFTSLNTPAEVTMIFVLGLVSSIMLVWMLSSNSYTSLIFLGKFEQKEKQLIYDRD